jgi:hypothetical protein
MLCERTRVDLWRSTCLGILGRLDDILGGQESRVFLPTAPKLS